MFSGCDDGYICLPDIRGNPESTYGYTNYDHIGYALLTSFQLMEKMGVEELMRRAWVRATASFKELGTPNFGITGIQQTIPEGKRLLGLGTIKGTPILANSYSGNPTCYKTASGEVHDTRKIMGSGDGLSFSDGVFANAEGQKYHGFVCNPPPLLADAGSLLIEVYQRVGDPSGLPAIVSVGLDEASLSYTGPRAAEKVVFS